MCLLAGESATVRSRVTHFRESTRPGVLAACRSSTRSFDYVVRVAIHRGIEPLLNTSSIKDGTMRWLRHHDKY
jgi:hypothetical protein